MYLQFKTFIEQNKYFPSFNERSELYVHKSITLLRPISCINTPFIVLLC